MSELIIADTRIRQDAEGRYCLNDLHKAAVSSGGNARTKEPGKFLASPQTVNLVQELVDTQNLGIAPVNVWQGGKNQGTYVVKELVYAYGMWISAAFHLKVIRAYDRLVMGQTTTLPPKTAPSLNYRADAVVSAARCFNGLMRVAGSLKLDHSQAATAADQSAMRHTGVSVLSELGISPDDLPEHIPQTRPKVPSAADDLENKVKEWLDKPEQADLEQITGEQIIESLFGINPEHHSYRSLVTRIGHVMSRLGWRKERGYRGSRKHYYERRV